MIYISLFKHGAIYKHLKLYGVLQCSVQREKKKKRIGSQQKDKISILINILT